MKRRLAIAAGVVAAAGLLALAPAVFPAQTLAVSMRVERGRAGLVHRTVEAAGHTIHYLDGGPAGAPVLLLLHGFNGDKDNWTRVSRFFTDRYRVIAPDLPGWGESTRDPDVSYDLFAQAERIEAFASALKLGKVHLAGNSMGGQLAGVYAGAHPERVLSVAFIDNAGVTSPKKSELTLRIERGENPLLVKDGDGYGALLSFIFVEVPWIPGPVRQYFADRAVQNRAFTEKIWRDLHERPARLEPLLPSLQAPALIVWGDTDRVIDVSTVEAMKPLLPGAEVVIMEACGHVPIVERPEETARHYLSFLSKR